MGTVHITMLDNSVGTSNRVTTDAARQIIEKTGFPGDYELIYNTELGGTRRVATQPGRSSRFRTNRSNLVFITARETYKEENFAQGFDVSNQNDPILEDKELGLYALPTYLTVAKEIEFKFVFHSLTALNTWRRDFAIKNKMTQLAYSLSVGYEYSLPSELLIYLKHIYTLHEDKTTLSEKDFLNQISPRTKIDKTNKTGLWGMDVIYEKQVGVVGHFDNETFFNEKDISEEQLSVSATFKFDYLQVVGMLVEFPYVVHNSLVDDYFLRNWFKKPIVKTTDEQWDTVPTRQIGKFKGIEKENVYKGDGGLRHYDYDDWFPKHFPSMTKTLLISPMQVLPTDLTLVEDLNAFLKSYLDNDLVDFIIANPTTATKLLENPYHLQLYQLDEHGESQREIVLDAQGILRTTTDLSTRKRYYLRVSYISDHSLVLNNMIRQFLTNKQTMISALLGLIPNIREIVNNQGSVFTKLGSNARVPLRLYGQLINQVSTTSNTYTRISPRIFASLNNLQVTAKGEHHARSLKETR